MKPRTLRLAAVGLAGLLLLAWAPAARALSPEAFLAVAYSQYGTAPDPRGSKEEQVLSEGLLGLHRRAETLRGQRLRRTPDLDPVEPISLCRCQDWDEAAYRIVKVETRPGPTGLTARLRVRLAPSGPPLTVFLRLAPLGDDWRIADMADPRPDGQPGEWLSDRLRSSIAEDEAALKRRR
ncbi:MAG: hypothetical protein ACKOD3_09995 [Phenylobacterium sp.]